MQIAQAAQMGTPFVGALLGKVRWDFGSFFAVKNIWDFNRTSRFLFGRDRLYVCPYLYHQIIGQA